MFLLKKQSINKTLFNRIPQDRFMVMKPLEVKQASASPTKSMVKGKKKKQVQATALENKVKIVLVNASDSKEQDKKASYENIEEAKTLAVYLDQFHNFLDMDSIAIMSPIRS